MKLNDTKVRNIKPQETDKRYTDGKGLYLFVLKSGGKSFRIDYTSPEGKRKTYTIGLYPTVSLAEARKELAELKIKLKQGIDPQDEKKSIVQAEIAQEKNTFEVVALEWLDKIKNDISEDTLKKKKQSIQKNIFPFLAKKQIDKISPKDILDLLKRLEERNKIITLNKVKGICSQIFCYGIATCRCEYDLTAGLQNAFKKADKKNFASITDKKLVGQLLRDIDKAYFENKRISLYTILAMKMIMYTLTRSQEVYKAKWEEFDLENGIWIIPSEHKKERREHTVFLSSQVMAILEELKPYTEHTGFLFPSERSKSGHIGGDTLSKALRDVIGYKGKHTIHGFRAMASTLLNEEEYNPDVIEKSLAHKDKDGIRAIYNRAEYIEQRKKLLQDYADYLDRLKREIEA